MLTTCAAGRGCEGCESYVVLYQIQGESPWRGEIWHESHATYITAGGNLLFRWLLVIPREVDYLLMAVIHYLRPATTVINHLTRPAELSGGRVKWFLLTTNPSVR